MFAFRDGFFCAQSFSAFACNAAVSDFFEHRTGPEKDPSPVSTFSAFSAFSAFLGAVELTFVKRKIESVL